MSDFVDILRDVLEDVEIKRDRIEWKTSYAVDPEAIAYQNGQFKGIKEAEKVLNTAIAVLVFTEDDLELTRKCYTFFAANRLSALLVIARVEGTNSQDMVEQLAFEGESTTYRFVLDTIHHVEKGA